METIEYKKLGTLSTGKKARLILCLVLLCQGHFCENPLAAETKEEELARSVLAQVEKAAQKTKSLESFGKETFPQSMTILDLGELALPALLSKLNEPNPDWKLRYWIVDAPR